MLHGIFIASLIIAVVQLVKESLEKPIPLENLENKILMKQDKKNGISDKELRKNIRNGKYILNENYSAPPRTKEGYVIVEDNISYKEDCEKYGWVEARFMAKKGKYNLSEEEKKKEEERVDKKYKNVYLIK